MTSNAVVAKILADAVKKAGLWGVDQQISFPLITNNKELQLAPWGVKIVEEK
jgi:hypothetical protein